MSDVLELLKELIRCPSVTPDDAGCQQIAAQRLERAGFKVRHMRFGAVDNLWATHGSGAPLFCFAGHTDVVPPGPREAWVSDPFTPTEENGELIGRGAVDMKASVAAMIVACERLAAEGHEGTVALLLTSDEEGPGVDGTQRVLRQLLDEGVKIDYALVGEPTSEEVFGDAIKVGRRGSMSARIEVRGVQGHTAYPQLADNAAHRLAAIMGRILDLDWGAGTDLFQLTTLQFTNLSAGTGAGNVIPGVATADLNIRFGVDWAPEAIQEAVRSAIGVDLLACQTAWTTGALPFITSAGELSDALGSAVEEIVGIKPRLSTGGGTSDARFFAQAGIAVAEFGPINRTIHAANEKVHIEHLALLSAAYVETGRLLLND